MKKSKYYALEMINGETYLLPFGQNIADQRRSFLMNETGVFLWNHLEEAETDEQLLDLLLHDESLTIDEEAEVKGDLLNFLSVLKQAGAILSDPAEPSAESSYVSIAGIVMELKTDPLLISKQFDDFRIFSNPDSDLLISIIPGGKESICGEVNVIDNRELRVFETEQYWHLIFPTFDNIPSVKIDKALKKATIHVRYLDDKVMLRENLFHVLRHIFLLKAQSMGYFAIHSASILYRGMAYLFSGPSGTGKSTHTKLWKEQFDVQDINGDLNLLSDEGIVYGIPWCGTSNIYTAKQYPLGGIVFLKQAKENNVTLLEGADKSLRISQRLISPVFNQEQLEENLSFAVNLGKRIPSWLLQCTKNPDAAQLMKQTIDQYRNRSVQ